MPRGSFRAFSTALAAALTLFTGAAQAAPAITLKVAEMRDDTSVFDDAYCKTTFDISNVSAPGTIDRLVIKAHIKDDRGRKVSANPFQAHIRNTSRRDDFLSIPVGSTLQDVGEIWIEEECQYVGEIKLGSMDKEDCAIRMLPEDADCNDLVELVK